MYNASISSIHHFAIVGGSINFEKSPRAVKASWGKVREPGDFDRRVQSWVLGVGRSCPGSREVCACSC